MKYEVIPTISGYNVKEMETGLVVKSFSKSGDAVKLANHLNRKGAFCGMTPPFMCEKVA